MAANVREVELALQVSTSNVDAIRKLQTDVANLAKSSGDAAPEFQKLSAELDKLAQDAVGLQKLTEAAASVDKVAAAQATAADRARELTAAYNTLKGKTDEAAAAQAAAKAAYDQAKNSTAELGDQIKQLKADNTGAARETYAYTSALKDLITQQIASRSATRETKTAYDEAKVATAAARKEQNDLSNDYRNAVAQATALSAKLQAQQADYADLAQATLGVSTAQVDLIGSSARLQAAMNSIRTAVQDTAAEEQRAAQAKKAAAAEDERAAARALAISQQQQAQAKAEADGIIRDYARMEAAQKQAAATAKAAADAMAAAFGTVGAKSVEQLEAKIRETRVAMDLLKNSGALLGPELKVAMKQGEDAIAGFEREIRKANGTLTLADKAANLWNQSMGGMKASTLLAVGAISSLFQKATETGKAFLDSVTANERLVQSLNNVFKSSTVAADQIAFLRESANKAGVSVKELQQSFVKYSAAMTGANIPLEQANALFSQLTQASGSLGLSTDAVNRAMEALGQMASKGTVSMEELRQQLGDALPGALGLAAKGLGLTEAEVIKLVSSGQLAAKDFFPAFTEGLKTLSGEANTLTQNWARLKNGLDAFFIAIGDAGALDVMKAGLEGLRVTAQVFGMGIATVTETILGTTRALAAFAATLAEGGSFSQALKASGAEVDASVARLTKLNDSFRGVNTTSQAAAGGVGANTAALGSLSEAGAAAGASLNKLNLAAEAQAEKLDTAAKTAEINVKTAESLVSVQGNLSKGILDTNIAIDAEIAAKQGVVTATENLLAVRTEELDLAKGLFEATKLLLEQDGLLDEADSKRLQAMAEQIEKLAAVKTAIDAKVAASKADVAQAEIEKKMIQDNSGKIAELTKAYDAAKAALALLQKQKADGANNDKEIIAATQNLANASKLLGDSYSDQEAKLRAKNITAKAEFELTSSALEVQAQQYTSLGNLGKAIGDTNLVRQAEIGKLEVQIKLAEAHAKVMVAEADGNIAVAKAMLQKMAAMGQIDPVQKAQLEADIKLGEAQKNKAAAILEANKSIQQQINALRDGTAGLDKHASATGRASAAQDKFGRDTSAATAALERQNAALERHISAQEKANDLKQRAIDLENKRRNVDREGFSVDPKTGNRINESVPTVNGIYQQLVSGGMGPAEAQQRAEALAKQAQDAMASASKLTSGGIGGIGSPFNQKTMQDHINDALRESAVKKDGGVGSVAKTYNVTFGGQTVKTTSDAEAQKLMNMLKQAKGSA